MKSPNEKEKFLAVVREVPILAVACKNSGIAKSTVYRWIKRNSKFNEKLNEAMSEGRESVNDIAESQLIATMRKGERWAICYWLESNADRYRRPKKPMEPPEKQHVGATSITIRGIVKVKEDGTEIDGGRFVTKRTPEGKTTERYYPPLKLKENKPADVTPPPANATTTLS